MVLGNVMPPSILSILIFPAGSLQNRPAVTPYPFSRRIAYSCLAHRKIYHNPYPPSILNWLKIIKIWLNDYQYKT